MRRLIVPAALISVLLLAGCSGTPDAGASASPTSETTVEPATITSAADITSLEEGINFVLGQDAGTMRSNEIINSALKLREYSSEEYSQAKLGDITADLVRITVDGVEYDSDVLAPTLQQRLVELTKQIRELA